LDYLFATFIYYIIECALNVDSREDGRWPGETRHVANLDKQRLTYGQKKKQLSDDDCSDEERWLAPATSIRPVNPPTRPDYGRPIE